MAQLETVPAEVLLNIISNLEPKTIVKLCETNSYFQNSICRGEEFSQFWRKLYQRDIDPHVPENPRAEYVRIMRELNALPDTIKIEGYSENRDITQRMVEIEYAVKHHYRKLLDNLIKKDPNDFVFAFDRAAYYGHLDIVKSLLESLRKKLRRQKREDALPTFLAYPLRHATSKNHKKVIDYLIGQGGSISIALITAARVGNRHLFKELLSQGLSGGHFEVDDIDEALYFAAGNNHPDIVEDLISQHGNVNMGLFAAAMGGHLDIVRRLIEHGANDFDEPIRAAALHDHKTVVDELLDHGADINHALYGAANGGHEELVEYLINRGATNLNGGLGNASTIPVADILLNHGATDLNGAIIEADHIENYDVANYLRSIRDKTIQ